MEFFCHGEWMTSLTGIPFHFLTIFFFWNSVFRKRKKNSPLCERRNARRTIRKRTSTNGWWVVSRDSPPARAAVVHHPSRKTSPSPRTSPTRHPARLPPPPPGRCYFSARRQPWLFSGSVWDCAITRPIVEVDASVNFLPPPHLRRTLWLFLVAVRSVKWREATESTTPHPTRRAGCFIVGILGILFSFLRWFVWWWTMSSSLCARRTFFYERPRLGVCVLVLWVS